MKRYLLLLTLLVASPAYAQQQPFQPVFGSTKSLSCTDASTSSSRTLLHTTGRQLKLTGNGANKCFFKYGGSTVTAGTSDSVILPSSYLLYTRDPSVDTHIACVCAAGETLTLFAETGNGE